MAIRQFLFAVVVLFLAVQKRSTLAQGDVTLRFDPIISWPGYASGDELDLCVVQSKAYIAMSDGGLAVVDVANGQQSLLARLDLPGDSRQVKVSGNLAFLGCGTGGVHIVSVQN